MSGPSERDEIVEPILLQSIRRMAERDPERHVRIINGTGTTVRGFVAEVDDWLAERDRRTAATAVREALGSDEEPDMLRAMLHDAADRLANPRHRGNEHAWPKHAAMFRHLAGRIERNQ